MIKWQNISVNVTNQAAGDLWNLLQPSLKLYKIIILLSTY